MNANARPVKGPEGFVGTVDTTCWPSMNEKPDPQVDLVMEDGSHLTIQSDVLIEQNDGSFYIPLHRHELDQMPHRDRPAPGTDDCWPCREKEKAKQAEAGVVEQSASRA